ncbi:Agamous-like MADS-box protein AGL15 [Porphyridium purpureum]|uniref:Agamous-like MADS-box protein AGL15 n=1 Tax=Porphyridium purpureum TaxID=35688 RepID=A0A5J4Z8J9_PORPP|nr:Agamous-like MADS-box protein AGL15 [Porphyridium purpureum]|eukprot:POR0766..scf295_1
MVARVVSPTAMYGEEMTRRGSLAPNCARTASAASRFVSVARKESDVPNISATVTRIPSRKGVTASLGFTALPHSNSGTITATAAPQAGLDCQERTKAEPSELAVRKKIQIRRIENDRARAVTFSKRKNGLLKKAKELSVLCDCEVMVVIFTKKGKLVEYSSAPQARMLEQYAAFSGTAERRDASTRPGEPVVRRKVNMSVDFPQAALAASSAAVRVRNGGDGAHAVLGKRNSGSSAKHSQAHPPAKKSKTGKDTSEKPTLSESTKPAPLTEEGPCAAACQSSVRSSGNDLRSALSRALGPGILTTRESDTAAVGAPTGLSHGTNDRTLSSAAMLSKLDSIMMQNELNFAQLNDSILGRVPEGCVGASPRAISHPRLSAHREVCQIHDHGDDHQATTDDDSECEEQPTMTAMWSMDMNISGEDVSTQDAIDDDSSNEHKSSRDQDHDHHDLSIFEAVVEHEIPSLSRIRALEPFSG